MRAAGRTLDLRADDGQLTVLVIGFAVVLALLVAVVVDASRVFLDQRSLSAATDGAALVAAQAADTGALYRGRIHGTLPIDPAAARVAVERYVADADLADRFVEFGVIDVTVAPDGGSVRVTFTSGVELPLGGLVLDTPGGRYRVTTTAAARSPVIP